MESKKFIVNWVEVQILSFFFFQREFKNSNSKTFNFDEIENDIINEVMRHNEINEHQSVNNNNNNNNFINRHVQQYKQKQSRQQQHQQNKDKEFDSAASSSEG